jgi:hypothetical protein
MPETSPPAVEYSDQSDESLRNESHDHSLPHAQSKRYQGTSRLPSYRVELDDRPKSQKALDGPGSSRRGKGHQVMIVPRRGTLAVEMLVRWHLELDSEIFEVLFGRHCADNGLVEGCAAD